MKKKELFLVVSLSIIVKITGASIPSTKITSPTPQNDAAGIQLKKGNAEKTKIPPQTGQPAQPQEINCNYHTPTTQTNIAPTFILSWTEKALVQSFSFQYAKLDEQLTNLKACFTNEGWDGFNEALKKSGNLDTIKAQKLTTTSLVNGRAKIIEAKEKQWKISLPLEVTYQNEKAKSTQAQALLVDVLIERKASGDLGIMQIIAIPNTATVAKDANIVNNPTSAPAAPAPSLPGPAPPPSSSPPATPSLPPSPAPASSPAPPTSSAAPGLPSSAAPASPPAAPPESPTSPLTNRT